jgi:hypothetical protein
VVAEILRCEDSIAVLTLSGLSVILQSEQVFSEM